MNEDFQPFPAEQVAAKEALARARQPQLPLPKPKITIGTPPGPVAQGPQDIPGSSIYSHLRATTSPQAIGVASEVPEQIPVPSPGVGTPVSAADAISLDLPSRFAFYDFKNLYVKPFRGLHLSKLSRAHEEGSILPVLEAVSSVLTTDAINGIALAFRLTLPDFYFVLYWLRQNSFTKTIYTHVTQCRDEKHLAEVTAGTKPPESLKIVEQIRATRLEINTLEQMPNPEAFPLEYPGIDLRTCLMIDTVELTEDDDAANPEFQYLGRRACFIGVPGQDLTLRQRIEIIKDMSPEDLATVIRYEKAVNAYGVNETITVRCSGCGAKRDTKLTLNAHSFLSA